jgi:hypothetical protein
LGAQPAEDAIIERAETAPVVDTRVQQKNNTRDTVAPTWSKGYRLPTNSSIVSLDGIKQLKAFSYWQEQVLQSSTKATSIFASDSFQYNFWMPRPFLQLGVLPLVSSA